MKALCQGAFLDPSRQQQAQLQNPSGGGGGLSNDRRLGGSNNETSGGSSSGGIDFVDSAAATPSTTHHTHHHGHHLPCKGPLPHLSPPQPLNNSKSGPNSTNNFNAPVEMDADSSSASGGGGGGGAPLGSNDLTLLKSSVSHAQQQLLLHGLSAALTESGVRKSEESDYPTGPAWVSSMAEQKPSKFLDEKMDGNNNSNNRPPSASPHIHPVKRALKRFGNEQHRLSQQQKLHQQNVGKLDPDKT